VKNALRVLFVIAWTPFALLLLLGQQAWFWGCILSWREAELWHWRRGRRDKARVYRRKHMQAFT
jgi:hypothetical protein